MQRVPAQPLGGQHVLFEHFWVGIGPLLLPDPEAPPPGGRFVMTPSVSMHLRNLARAVLLRRYPILLQVIFIVSCAYACLYASTVCPFPARIPASMQAVSILLQLVRKVPHSVNLPCEIMSLSDFCFMCRGRPPAAKRHW